MPSADAVVESVQFERLGLGERLSPYLPTWDYQREVHARVSSGELPAQVLYVEHEPVYTAGHRTTDEQRPHDGTPVIETDRGGLITYPGPGQLVGYPIVRLPDRVGPVAYVRRLEEAIIRTLRPLGIEGGRVEGRTGVWLRADQAQGRLERKIAAIGVRVSRRTTLHGFALNVAAESLGPFAGIIPCGIADADVTSIETELGVAPSLADVADAITPHLAELLTWHDFEMAGWSRD